MLRMLGALQTIGSLTDSTIRRRILSEQLHCIAEFAARPIESTHDRARFYRRLAEVRASLEAEPDLRAQTEGEKSPR